MRLLLGLCAALLVLAAPAQAEERLLTFYSPPIDSEPYVHKSTWVTLKADGAQAPAEAGSVLGFKEQVLVDSKDTDAKPLPVSKMMVHHLLYYTPGRVDQGSGQRLRDPRAPALLRQPRQWACRCWRVGTPREQPVGVDGRRERDTLRRQAPQPVREAIANRQKRRLIVEVGHQLVGSQEPGGLAGDLEVAHVVRFERQ